MKYLLSWSYNVFLSGDSTNVLDIARDLSISKKNEIQHLREVLEKVCCNYAYSVIRFLDRQETGCIVTMLSTNIFC